jgi:AcrR family transcriptional regulator
VPDFLDPIQGGPRGALRWVHPPRQQRSRKTLDRILDAAEALVSEKGFEDTPVAEIVRRAGSSVGAFYTRFEDKDALLSALYERYYEQAIATADITLDPARWEGASIREILDSVIRFLVEIYREQAGLIRAFVLRHYTSPEFRQKRERLSRDVNERLSALLLERRDEIRHPDPELAAVFGLTLVFNALDGAILFGQTHSDVLPLSDDALAAELARAYGNYLGAASNRTPKE